MEKPAEPVPNGMENGDGADDEGNEWQVRENTIINNDDDGNKAKRIDFNVVLC